MTVYYNRTKTMKSAKIGTIMAWGGDGNEGFLQSNLPNGWILCDGKTYAASKYPLLASMIGDTYGGSDFSGVFPDYLGTFKVPDMSAKCLMDLEPYMLTDSRYQRGQQDAVTILGTKVLNYGSTTPIPTLISADANINFTVNSKLTFVGKMTNISITNPDFNTTIYTVDRKLGINHMPGHKHPGTYSKVRVDPVGPMVFQSSYVKGSGTVTNSCNLTRGFIECQSTDAEAMPSWQNGAASLTFYGDETRENTLITTDQFNEFVNTETQNWDQVPASVWPTSLASNFTATEWTEPFSDEPVTTHAQPAWSGMFPRPGTYLSKRNYFGWNTGAINPLTGLRDDPETVAAFTVPGITIPVSATRILLPMGTDIGEKFDKILPFMLVTNPNIPAGTQILNVNRISGTSISDYVYEIELSNSSNNSTSESNQTVIFRHGSYPTTMNTAPEGQDPNTSTFTGHNHGTFEIQMSKGNLSGPATHPVTNVSIGDVSPENISDALNILVDITAPSLNVTYLIKAY